MSDANTRRDFLKGGLAVAAGVASVSAALAPLGELQGEFDAEAWLQSHYHEMSPEERAEVIARLEREARQAFGREDITISDPQAKAGTKFAYALNLGVCVGCRRCAYACEQENNTSRAPGKQYIRVLEMNKGSIDLESANHHYDVEQVPQPGKFYMPVQCHQCDKPPCVKVCPVQATWKEPDGIVVVDYDWCIGCRYCEAACPYWARRFNFETPKLKPEEVNPKTAYLSNRPRPVGVMEKCTFCLQRTREGRYPACLEACPTGARAFGNLYDPKSEIRYILEHKRVFVLKEEVGTLPNFFYYFDV
ncbi:MAG: 4Fe-4S dicluster domain-containing protein [Myxococcales bacterium]|nr:4Fe-4S dicluster domain-containing protein [Myxococcales bacterium]